MLFFALVVAMYKATQPAPVTSNFAEKAPRFYVLGSSEGKYEMLSLSDAITKTDKYQYHLDKDEITLNVGDVHSIRVLGNFENKQRIAFYYSNTYTSESIYEVSGNDITPIEYRITSSIGHVVIYAGIVLASMVIAPIASRLLLRWWRE